MQHATHRRIRAAIAAAVVALLTSALAVGGAAPAPAGPGAGTTTRATFPATATTPARDYLTYVPAALPAGPRPLVVHLHGCNQTAPDAAVGSRWNEVADREGFLVAYPEQSTFDVATADGNGSRCWNWFLPKDQERGVGEPGAIAGIVGAVATAHDVDPTRVYLSGISAGADMAVNLAATYPELWAGVAAFAGCPYRSCSDASGALTYAAMGPRARPVPLFVLQGTADVVSNVALGSDLLASWLGVLDHVDDGAGNLSVSRTPASVEHRGLDASVLDGLGSQGDLCVGSSRLPCAAGAAGWTSYPTTVARFDGAGRVGVVEAWLVHGLNHAHPGGDTAGTFTDPAGPSATDGAWDFFVRQS